MSLYSVKQGTSQTVIPWSQALTLFPSGGNLGNFYSLYNSLGAVTLTGANTLATLLDGPEKVVVYDSLTLGDGTTSTSLTASNRCKGLCIVVKGALTIKANATLHMTGKGARVLTNDDPFFPFVDFKIPTQISLSSSLVTYKQALAVIAAQGFAPWDQGTWQALVAQLFGFNLNVSQPGVLALLAAAGCGASVLGVEASSSAVAGNTGTAGISGGTGAGGSGGAYASSASTASFKSGAGSPYSGGAGSGGACGVNVNTFGCSASPFSGPGGNGGNMAYTNPVSAAWPGDTSTSTGGQGGGGAGNPGGKQGAANGAGQTDGGTGTGGKLVIIANTITVQTGGVIAANGVAGGSGAGTAGYAGGGGSGGGHLSIIIPTSGAYSNSGTVQALGGTGGTGSYPGGAGGAGSVVVKQFSDLGW